jgi:hypothetical protein
MRRSPSAETLKFLYVRSGNECAFGGCTHPIFNDDGLYIAQLCHIKAAEKGGPRFDPMQSEEERKSPENLLFMCHRHHKETDAMTTEQVKEIKQKHELKFSETGRKATQNMIRQVLFEIDNYWDQLSRKTFEHEGFKVERDFDKGIFELIDEIDEHFQRVMFYCDTCAQSDSSEQVHKDLEILFSKIGLDQALMKNVPYHENPFVNRNWELHNIGRPNFNTHFKLTINQLRVKLTEELLKTDPSSQKLKNLLEKFRTEFNDNYSNSYYVD